MFRMIRAFLYTVRIRAFPFSCISFVSSFYFFIQFTHALSNSPYDSYLAVIPYYLCAPNS